MGCGGGFLFTLRTALCLGSFQVRWGEYSRRDLRYIHAIVSQRCQATDGNMKCDSRCVCIRNLKLAYHLHDFMNIDISEAETK